MSGIAFAILSLYVSREPRLSGMGPEREGAAPRQASSRKVQTMDTGRSCYVSMAHLMSDGGDDRHASGDRSEKWESELMSLDDMQFSVMGRAEFMAMASMPMGPATVHDILSALVNMAKAGRLRGVAGVMVDMRIRAAVPGRKILLQAIKALLTQQVEVILVDGDGYFVNLLELDQFCTSRDFVDMYMHGIFSDHWSFSVMPKSIPAMGSSAALSAG